MTVRIIALWLTINTLFFNHLDKVKMIKAPSNKNKIAQAFGEINKKYAIKLSEEHTKRSEQELK